MTRRTPLFDLHQKLGAKIVDFGGWDMPLNYGSQIAEHHAVRRGAGVFDVSHMSVVDLHGGRKTIPPAAPREQRRQAEGVRQSAVSAMLKSRAASIDDLIVYFSRVAFRAVVNAGRATAISHGCGGKLRNSASTSSSVRTSPCWPCRVRKHAARPRACFHPAAPRARMPRAILGREIDGRFVARTGYTGEDGFEIMLPVTEAERVWTG